MLNIQNKKMNTGRLLLVAGIGLSLIVHGSVLSVFLKVSGEPVEKKEYKSSVLVPVTVRKKEKKPEKKIVQKRKPEPVKKKKKKIKITKKTKVRKVPISHKRKTEAKEPAPETVKPVFGVTKKTVEKKSTGTGIGVRAGNTLMKEQEEEYTPPEKVRDYITVPVFDLTTMPVFKKRVRPEFPEILKKREVEGEVFLSAEIDDLGMVTMVTVLKSDHELFAKAAVSALKASRFAPATQNGEPVGTVLEDLVYTFVLDE